MTDSIDYPEQMQRDRAEIERLRAGLDAAIRAANLALFVIRKQNVMPNSSWESGFAKDMAVAKAARGDEQTGDEAFNKGRHGPLERDQEV